jgi:hypothetical protein
VTRPELLAAISTRIGLGLREQPGAGRLLAVDAVSPTGVVLFEVTLVGPRGRASLEHEQGWAFGGCGSPLQGCWSELCQIGRAS